MNWTPIVRRDHTEDFADFTGIEHDHGTGLVMSAYDPALLDGTELSSYPFIEAFREANGSGESQIADMHLRYAANRGDWYAMVVLAEDRNELEHDDESWRWASRLVFLLSNPENEFADYLPHHTRESVIQDAQNMMEICMKNGADPNQDEPRDVGVSAEEKYCLAHGILLLRGTPREKCDDSVHMATRRFG
jgi:hypothetical protein